ncbi:type III-B CRISPR module-associated protein Cmr5 [Paenibacillus pabuli]|uniref:type III-B CRISPR module-associated protein Cmr5 n=1 Tax=Paenibacillus pabuli TaxID=1472 RepID=UPI0020000C26|nr:type III-B CRISPR module-associated protein Cmr5 [Paenibacillus pabuli]UPK45004.1 type III-B CRISPR module-associated protein Cmr5 [Paenibacillus pabuli]
MSNQMQSMQQIEGGRASFAFQEVKKAVDQLGRDSTKVKLYSSYLKRLPSMIQVNGLGQAMAFYYSKKNKEVQYGLIYKSISDWIISKSELPLDHNKEFMDALVELNSEPYRRVTAEVMSLLNWMRKFATGMHAELDDNKSGSSDAGTRS